MHRSTALAWDKFPKFNKPWKNWNLSTAVKMHFFDASMIPTILYATEALKVSIVQNKYIRKVLPFCHFMLLFHVTIVIIWPTIDY